MAWPINLGGTLRFRILVGALVRWPCSHLVFARTLRLRSGRDGACCQRRLPHTTHAWCWWLTPSPVIGPAKAFLLQSNKRLLCSVRAQVRRAVHVISQQTHYASQQSVNAYGWLHLYISAAHLSRSVHLGFVSAGLEAVCVHAHVVGAQCLHCAEHPQSPPCPVEHHSSALLKGFQGTYRMYLLCMRASTWLVTNAWYAPAAGQDKVWHFIWPFLQRLAAQ